MHAYPFGKIKVHPWIVKERERERGVCVCSFLISSFFNSENSSTYFKVSCRSLQKNLIVRDVLE